MPVRCLARSLDSESATALRALAKVELIQVIALHQSTHPAVHTLERELVAPLLVT